MKKIFTLFIFMLFYVFGSANNVLTFKILDSNKDYFGFDKLLYYKSGIFKEGDTNIPIEYYTFHSERYASHYVYIDKGATQSNSGAVDKTKSPESPTNSLLGLSKNEDDNDNSLMNSQGDLDANVDTDYIIQGMVVIDKKANLIFYKSEELLKNYFNQKRTIRIIWDFKNRGYDIDIIDNRLPESKRKKHIFIPTSNKLPIMDNFKSFCYLYLLKNNITKRKIYVRGLTIFNYAMKKTENTSFNPLYPGEGNILPPEGKTRFYDLAPFIRKSPISRSGDNYYFDDFDFTINLQK